MAKKKTFREQYPTFEDWTPPWGEDPDEIDPERIAKALFRLHTTASERAERIAEVEGELEDANDAIDVFKKAQEDARKAGESAEDREKRESQELKEAKRANDKLRVQIKTGLTDKQMKRVVGDDYDALLKDAEEFKAELGDPKPDDETDEEREEREAAEAAVAAEEDDDFVTPERQPKSRRAGNRNDPPPNDDDIDAYFREQDKANGVTLA